MCLDYRFVELTDTFRVKGGSSGAIRLLFLSSRTDADDT
jgi:hypothetical protein